MSREAILELDHRRAAIEQELKSILDYLDAPGMPGLKGSLVDQEGFPYPHLDHYKIKEMRQKFNTRNNDYTAVMKEIEREMAAYWGSLPPSEPSPVLPKAEISVSPISTVQPLSPPFAFISEVAPGSPAFEAGILVNDRVTNVGNVTAFNHRNLSALAEEVRSHLNQSLAVSVVRRNEINEEMRLELTITPKTWAGTGILGCRFMPLSPTE